MPVSERQTPIHAPMTQFPVSEGELRVGGMLLSRLAARVGQTPFYYPVAIGTRMNSRTPQNRFHRRTTVHTARFVGRQEELAQAQTQPGDLVVIYQSSAYGFTASPQAFLGHPALYRGSCVTTRLTLESQRVQPDDPTGPKLNAYPDAPA